jgi:hypothetical protein
MNQIIYIFTIKISGHTKLVVIIIDKKYKIFWKSTLCTIFWKNDHCAPGLDFILRSFNLNLIFLGTFPQTATESPSVPETLGNFEFCFLLHYIIRLRLIQTPRTRFYFKKL